MTLHCQCLPPSGPTRPDVGADHPQPIALRPGEQIACFGDSITHGGNYHQKLHLLLATRFPGSAHWTTNVGWAGTTARGAIADFAWNQPPAASTLVLLHYGMNDVDRDAYLNRSSAPGAAERSACREDYQAALHRLLDLVEHPGRRIVILSPTIYDDTMFRGEDTATRPHLNAELALFGRIGRQIALDRGHDAIDLHTPMDALTRCLQTQDPRSGLTSDRVHPTEEAGSDLIFASIAMRLALPDTIYRVELAADGSVQETIGATVRTLRADSGQLDLTLTEYALPYPVTAADSGLSHTAFAPDLNRQTLHITGLAAGRHRLSIDGEAVATFSAREFATGVDLAPITSTPQYRRSLDLRHTILGRKYELERILRTLNAMRGNLQRHGLAAGIDWSQPDPAAVEAARLRLVAIQGKPVQWAAYVHATAREHFPRWQAIHSELDSIRRYLSQLPSSREHHYRITALDA